MKATTISLFAVIFCLGCNQQSNRNTEVMQGTEYTKWLKQNHAQLSDSLLHYRDSIYLIHKQNPIYKRLYIEKVLSDSYLLIVEQLGYLLLTRSEHRFMLDDRRMKYIEQIPGAQEFLLEAGMLAFRGEYIPEFETLVDEYIYKYGFYGTVNNTITDGSKSKLTSFKYNLFYGKLYVDNTSKEALDAMAQASLNYWFTWETKTTNKEMGNYIHPEFVYQDEFYLYLKTHYPSSNYLPEWDYELSAQQLDDAYKENEVVADKAYRGKKIAIKGYVRNISKNAFDEPYITVYTGEILSDIICKFNNEDDLLSLKRNQPITIWGTCTGLFMGSVMLNDSHILNK